MAEKKEIYKAAVKQSNIWNYKDIYNMLFRWFKDQNYSVKESSYNEKLSSGGKEIVVKWEASKKVTDYFKYQIKADWHILGMKDVETEVDGKKVNMNKGEVEIKFTGSIIRDYEERWEDKMFWKFLRGIYEKYVIRETIDEYEDDLEDDVREVIKELKAFLNIPGR